MGSLTEKLEYLNGTKKAIRNALISRYVNVSQDLPFREYADKILEIKSGVDVDIEPITITENGDYNAPSGTAYNPISVDVQPNLGTQKFTENGIYKASDDHVDGYSEVEVAIPDPIPNVKELKITSEDMPLPPASKTFDAKKDDEVDGYSKVTVDMTGLVGKRSQKVEIDTKSVEEITIRAADDNLYGYSEVTFTVIEDPGPFTVEFWDGSTRLFTATNVNKHEYVDYKAVSGRDLPKKDGFTFKKWNPQPTDVTSDLKCYAEWVDDSTERPTHADGTLDIDWTEIAANGGADIKVGSRVVIYYGDWTYDGHTVGAGALVMKKVASGEHGTTSTWLSTTALPNPEGLTGYRWYTQDGVDLHKKVDGWPSSDFRQALNTNFLNAIKSRREKKYARSAAIADAIKPVPKYTLCYDNGSEPSYSSAISYTASYGEEDDSIWIPSYYEATGSIKTAMSGAIREDIGTVYKKEWNATNMITRTTEPSVTMKIVDPNTITSSWQYPFRGKLVYYTIGLSYTGIFREHVAHGWYDPAYKTEYDAHNTPPLTPYAPSYISGAYIGFCT